MARSYDLQSLEERVYNMDNSVIRSYDVYSIEKRIYDLEQNGGGEQSLPQFDLIQGTVASADLLNGTATASSTYTGYPAENALITGGAWIAASNNPKWTYTFDESNKYCVNKVTWEQTDAIRNQTPTKFEITTDGETWETITPAYINKLVIVALPGKYIKAFRITFGGNFGSSSYPLMANMKIYGDIKE